ncbi:MAG: hypothetical protein EPO02_02775 [Nitrospirae bacterium]|nr:MAG: hypothetical protein EPO02_02775 [Nitrospirota bacterium]
MAQKFGNGRWVQEGFLDNRRPGRVVGRITFAAVGPVEFLLRGDFKGEIHGKLIIFGNPSFEDDDVAGHVLGDLENPQTGEVSLMSFDPHPHLPPHPYLEWFSDRDNHYRIELAVGAARIASAEEESALASDLAAIAARFSALPAAPAKTRSDSDWV